MESAQQSDGVKSSTKYVWVAIAVLVFVFVIYIVSALTSNTFVADIRDGGCAGSSVRDAGLAASGRPR